METTINKVHHGLNVKRLREILDIKQDVIATELKISQQAMSKLEKKEVISDETLEKISKVLGVPFEVIKNFNNELAVNIIANTFNDSSSSFVYQQNVNPIEKITELYERLLKSEQEKNVLLEKMIKN